MGAMGALKFVDKLLAILVFKDISEEKYFSKSLKKLSGLLKETPKNRNY